jgi:hypothetical protein
MSQHGERNEKPNEQAFRMRLPGFIVEREIGLGDVIKRATRSLGIKPCSGCEQRAAALNRRIVFGRLGKP